MSWVLGSLQTEFATRVPDLLNGGCDDEPDIDFPFGTSDPSDFIEAIFRRMSEMDFHARKKVIQNLADVLGQRAKNACYKGISESEKMAGRLRTLFNLSCLEVELCIFLFIISSYDPPEKFFSFYLDSEKFRGRRYMCNALAASFLELNEALSGTLSKSGIIEVNEHEVRLSDEFLCLFQNPSAKIFEDKFYQKTPKDIVPLDHHFVGAKQTAHLMRLLKNKPDTPTHVLLYGEPGTGKTSYAHGLVKELDVPSYEISRDTDNKSKNRRAAITAALNMTNTGPGSILIVDEADNLLNTRNAWHARGETQDKGYLNQLMEESGVRIIWICNSIENIEHSTLRRFAFSLKFKPFTRTQRIKLFDNIIRKNRVKRFFQSKDIESLAWRYDVNAGTIDLAIKKAMESQLKSKRQVKNAVEMGLEAYQSMISGPAAPPDQYMTENAYSLDGLNIDGDIHSEIHLLEKFNEHLRQGGNHGVERMNLLFYGPPGTGKSELGRYIADRLERGIICKRLSDILSPYVGMSEKNIRNAFDEAQREEAVLMIDEADSVLFPRNKAVRSWESSQTNEFLTAMERFKGVLICTTNMISEIDNAAMRRFSRKIKFDFLEPKGNMTFYKKFLQPLLNQPIDNTTQSALLSMKYLTPGDFKVVRDQFAFFPRKELNPKVFLKALGRETQLKKIESPKNPIGFGSQ
ncbi:MAG: AAA family ATPase [Desulfovibrionales bacterium]